MKKRTCLIPLLALITLPSIAGSQTLDMPAAKKNEVSTIGIMPSRGMTMEQVKKSFGAPEKIIAAVGKPPITRWLYDGFAVYFENDRVIHSLAGEEIAK